jgi:probable rRNA maturation factor
MNNMSLDVNIVNNQEICKIDEELIEKISKTVLENELLNIGFITGNFSVSVIFVDNEFIRDLNAKYRLKDSPTDVLSFSYLQGENGEEIEIEGEPIEVGEVFLSVETLKTQALEWGNSLEREIIFILIHGLLHLCGFNHENKKEKEEMFEKQEMYFAKFV